MPILFSFGAFLATMAGGYFALRHQHRLLAIMSFSAGVLLGVVALDLLPEISDLAYSQGIDMHSLMVTALIGFLVIFLLEKLAIIHGERMHGDAHHHHHVGVVGASGLVFHSLLDGVAIGVGFQAGQGVGVLVLIAVLAHDFADGLNTVTFLLATKNHPRRALGFLVLDALAPIVGAALTLFVRFPPNWIAFQLAFFAGFLLYMGAADLLPHSHEEVRGSRVALTVLGVVVSGGLLLMLQRLGG